MALNGQKSIISPFFPIFSQFFSLQIFLAKKNEIKSCSHYPSLYSETWWAGHFMPEFSYLKKKSFIQTLQRSYNLSHTKVLSQGPMIRLYGVSKYLLPLQLWWEVLKFSRSSNIRHTDCQPISSICPSVTFRVPPPPSFCNGVAWRALVEY